MKTTFIFGIAAIIVSMIIGQLIVKRAYYQGQQDKICACELKDICTRYNLVSTNPNKQNMMIYECRIETK